MATERRGDSETERHKDRVAGRRGDIDTGNQGTARHRDNDGEIAGQTGRDPYRQGGVDGERTALRAEGLARDSDRTNTSHEGPISALLPA